MLLRTYRSIIKHIFLLIFVLYTIIITSFTTNSYRNFTNNCEPEGRFQMTVHGQTRNCLVDLDCLPPAKCLTKINSCCIFPLNQSVPPIGCPKGTRQLRKTNGEWLNCSPIKPGSCPGGTLCYQDSINSEQFRCCGKDPSEGCGTGQRVLKHSNGSAILCTPGTAECPGNAICEWSFDIDRFQCCESDNGCLQNEIPMFDSEGNVINCSLITPKFCPDTAMCRFNFWTATYQCCKPNNNNLVRHHSVLKESIDQRKTFSKECPQGEIIYKLDDREDKCLSDVDCPPMARCNLLKNICCGPPGECPKPGEYPVFDEHDNIQLCSSHFTVINKCPENSKCVESVDPLSGLLTGKQICCRSPQIFECIASGLPFPNEQNPLRCELNNPITCPIDMLCQASNISGISICCSGRGKTIINSNNRKRRREFNLCPKGWQPYEDLNIFCHPTLSGSCPGYSSCILSPISKQFVCCIPIIKEDEEEDKLNDNEYIDNNNKEIIIEKQNKRSNNNNIKNKNIPLIACFNNDDIMELTEDGYPRRCTFDKRIPCKLGFICQPLRGTSFYKSSSIGLCCSEKRSPHAAFSSNKKSIQNIEYHSHSQDASAFFRCPSSTQIPVIRQGQNLFCELPGQNCPPGSSCQSAINAFAMMICCRKVRQSSPRCPEGMTPERSPIGYVLCELLVPDQCKTGYQCVQSRDDPEQNICCSRTRNARPNVNAQYICPNQQVLLRDGSGPRFCSPSSIQSTCPKSYSCEEAIGQPGVFVCCSIPAQPICPTGFDSSLDLRSGNPIYCSPSDLSMCPAEADCLLAENRANTFLCCVSREPGRICPQLGQHALLQPNGQPEQCSGPGAPCSKPSYTCQLSYTLHNLYVCCGPPNSAIVCADGRETFHQEFGKTVQCNPMSLYSQCPSGFECALSNIPSMHVCCRRMDAPQPGGQPLPQAQTDVPPPPYLPSPRTSFVTFRPPIEDLGCPLGWSAYEDHRGAHHFCQDTLDMTCPHGFSCAQSSVEGIFMCCRLASPIQCPHAYSTLMVNNSPKLCSIASRQISSSTLNYQQQTTTTISTLINKNNYCPNGYTCMQSSIPAVYVCCGTITLPSMSTDTDISKTITTSSNELLCSNGQIPAYLGQFIRYCSNIGQISECPPSYICSPSNRIGLNVCCHPFPIVNRRSAAIKEYSDRKEDEIENLNICGTEALLALKNGKPIECNVTSECPQNYECQPSLINTKMYCCKQEGKRKRRNSNLDLFK